MIYYFYKGNHSYSELSKRAILYLKLNRNKYVYLGINIYNVKRVIVWFRNDLRIHDNEALTDSIKNADEIIPIYVLDDRLLHGTTSFGFKKLGPHRLRFLLESLNDLRLSLEKIGSSLIIRSGITEDVIANLAKEYKTSWISCNRERTAEEVVIQDQLEHNLWAIGQEIHYYRGKMLYHTADLPFPVNHAPDQFSSFRKEVEKFVSIRQPIESPGEPIPPLPEGLELGDIPTLRNEILSYIDHVPQLRGGETEALKQLEYYLWGSDLISQYKEKRNELLGRDYSSKLSSWLALGCISPKKIFSEITRYEASRTKNESTYELKQELLWRDYYRLMGKKHGNKIFQYHGTLGDHSIAQASTDVKLFKIWSEGRTGIPFIDANMKELNQTGYMSNRGRQNVASFLIKDLKLDWRMGAEYFESMILDYDPCSNYGNWALIAGVGSDTKADYYCNVMIQAKRYDADGSFVKHWIPSLKYVPQQYIHSPYKLSVTEAHSYGITLGKDYPQAIVHSSKWD